VSDIDPQEFGALKAEVASLRRDLGTINETLKEVNATLQEARGGWKTLMWLSGAAATLGAGASWVVSHVRFAP
jgi:hypothetical protein